MRAAIMLYYLSDVSHSEPALYRAGVCSEDRKMPEEPEGGRKDPSGKFITERIVGRRGRGRRILIFLLKSLAAGVLFSLAAIGTLIAARPLCEKYLKPPEKSSEIRLGREESGESGSSAEYWDSAEPGSGTESENGPEGGSAAAEPENGTEARESGDQAEESSVSPDEQVQAAMETYPYTIRDVTRLSDSVRSLASQIEGAVAEVTHVRDQEDWFENPLQTSGIYSGVAVARTDSELLVLTTESAAEDADRITVSFGSGPSLEASVKRIDSPSGLAVLTIPITDENRQEAEKTDPVSIGSSYRIAKGSLILALGAPCGRVYTEDYGIAAGKRDVSVTDGEAEVLTITSHSSTEAGTWFFDLGGNLIGFAADLPDEDGADDIAQAMGISEFKSLLERMINGQASPYLGIHGTAVVPEVRDQGIPSGIYVTGVDRGSPAYEAGIQPGDIISRVGRKTVGTMKDYTAALGELHAEDEAVVTAMRNVRDEYAPMEFTVRVGAR